MPTSAPSPELRTNLAALSTAIKASSGWRRIVLTIGAGALNALALPPYDIFAVCLLAFPVLVLLLDGDAESGGQRWLSRTRLTFRTGWLFGLGYFVASLWWIGTALLVDAAAFAWAIPLAVLGLPAFLALFYGFATLIAGLLWGNGLARIFALAFGFGLAEWLRAFLFTGFPWNAIGYAAMPTPLLMQSVTIFGLYGINALAVLVFAMPAMIFGGSFKRTGISIALILVATHGLYGYWRLDHTAASSALNSADGTTIRLVQASIAQDLKWNEEQRLGIFDRHLTLTKQPAAPDSKIPDIIIWPETSVPYIFEQTPQALRAIGDALQTGQTLLAGVVQEDKSGNLNQHNYFNSIYSINDQGQITDKASKVHLVPFGEYLPFEDILRRWGIEEIVEMPGGFTPAAERRSLQAGNQLSLLPLICYEAIFPSELGYYGTQADAIINITNDAWYGNTPGPYQHFRQAQLRAVEQGLPLLRAANNGLSAIIDPYGRITASLGLNEVGTIDGDLPASAPLFWNKPAGAAQLMVILLILLSLALAFRIFSAKRSY